MTRKPLFALAVATAMLATVASSLTAQEIRQLVADAGRGTVKVSDATPCCLSTLTAEEEARLLVRIGEADFLAQTGRMADAERTLKDVVRIQRRAGAYPARALRQLANVQFGQDRAVDAANTLVELADAAKAASDPVVEFTALVDATVVYGQIAFRGRQRQIVPRIRQLLNSPAIPVEMRREIAQFLPEQ